MLRIFAVAVAALMLAGCATNGPTQPAQTPDSVLRDIGFTSVVPPQTGFVPGVLVWNKRLPLGDGRVALGFICKPETTNFPPGLSVSPSSSLGFASDKSFDLGADGLRALGVGASADFVDSVSLRLENNVVLEYALEDLGTIRDGLGPICAGHLERSLANNNAFQVVSAFRADLSYRVEFKAGASAEIQSAVLTELGGRCGVAAQGGQVAEGRGLIYGLQLCDAGDCAAPALAPADAG